MRRETKTGQRRGRKFERKERKTHLEVGKSGVQSNTPVDESVLSVDETVLEELAESLVDSLSVRLLQTIEMLLISFVDLSQRGKAMGREGKVEAHLAQSESRPVPIVGSSQSSKLVRDLLLVPISHPRSSAS